MGVITLLLTFPIVVLFLVALSRGIPSLAATIALAMVTFGRQKKTSERPLNLMGVHQEKKTIGSPSRVTFGCQVKTVPAVTPSRFGHQKKTVAIRSHFGSSYFG